jgi:predicted MFS family arabinose efflux permease
VTFSTPAFFSAIFATATPADRGAAAGTASAFIDLGLGFGPIVLGLVAREQDLSWAFGVGCAIALTGAAWMVLLTQRERAAA